MAETVDELVVRIAGDFSQLQEAMKGANRVADQGKSKMGSAMERLRGGFNRATAAAGKWIAIAGGVVASFVSIRAIVSSLNAVDGLAKTADSLGIATEALGGLRHAAQLSGMSIQEMDMQLERLPGTLRAATEGGGRAAAALSQLGLSARSLMTLRPDQQMAALADALQGVEGSSQRAAIATELFGRRGVAMVNMLSQGSAELEKMKQEALDLGSAVNRFDAAKIEAANDSFTRLRAALEGVANRIAVALAPLLSYLSSQFIDGAKNAQQMTGFFEDFVNYAVKGVALVQAGWDGLVLGFHAARVVISNMSVAFWTVVDAIVKGANFASASFNVAWDAMKLVAINVFDSILSAASSMMKSMSRQIAAMAIAMAGSGVTPIAAMGNELASLPGIIATAAAGIDKTIGRSTDEAANALAVSAAALQDATDQLSAETSDTEVGRILQNAIDLRADAHKAMDDVVDEMGSREESRLEAATREFKEFRSAFDENALHIAEMRALDIENQLSEEDYRNQELAARRQAFLDGITNAERDAQEAMQFMWEMGARGKLQVMSGFFGQLAQLMNTRSRKMFEVGKAAATAQAIIDTYGAANSAYNAMAGIPIIGPALGAAAAAAAIVAGIANVQKIQSTSFGSKSAGGGGSGGGSGGVASAGAEAEAPRERQTNFNVVLQGERFSRNQVRGLMGMINDQAEDGVRISVQ